MKNNILVGLIVVTIFAACGQANSKKAGKEAASTETAVQLTEASVVNVYYFHGKQRCKTCLAVEKVAKETIEKAYADNKNVRFIEINTEDKANSTLVEKYQITWSALIIEKDDSRIDITKESFVNAVNNPDVLTELIKKEVNARL